MIGDKGFNELFGFLLGGSGLSGGGGRHSGFYVFEVRGKVTTLDEAIVSFGSVSSFDEYATIWCELVRVPGFRGCVTSGYTQVFVFFGLSLELDL